MSGPPDLPDYWPEHFRNRWPVPFPLPEEESMEKDWTPSGTFIVGVFVGIMAAAGLFAALAAIFGLIVLRVFLAVAVPAYLAYAVYAIRTPLPPHDPNSRDWGTY